MSNQYATLLAKFAKRKKPLGTPQPEPAPSLEPEEEVSGSDKFDLKNPAHLEDLLSHAGEAYRNIKPPSQDEGLPATFDLRGLLHPQEEGAVDEQGKPMPQQELVPHHLADYLQDMEGEYGPQAAHAGQVIAQHIQRGAPASPYRTNTDIPEGHAQIDVHRDSDNNPLMGTNGPWAHTVKVHHPKGHITTFFKTN